MKKLLVVVAALGFASVAIAGEHPGKGAEHAGKPAEHAGKPAEGKKGGVMSVKTATWTAMGDPKTGPWMSVVSGDPKFGAFTMFLKLKAGAPMPWHTHNDSYTGLVLEGTPTHQDQGGEMMKLSAGQAWTSAGGTNHLNTCPGKKDCVMFIASAGAMSFNMMDEKGMKMEMPAAPMASPAASPMMKK